MSKLMKQKYAFLDRDGTLIYEPTQEETKPGHVAFQIDSLDKLRILNGVIEGLQRLRDAGYQLVMVTNQDALGTEVFPQETFDEPQNRMLEIFSEHKIEFFDVLVCPHTPEDECNCRKPGTKMVDDFLQKQEVEWDKESSVMCGDSLCDKNLAINLGVRFVEMDTNGEFPF